MDVQVKLSLRGGHVWQFFCSEDDPIIVGLVSALPGAEAGSNLPADGLVQVEAQTGERLFLTRSSLVSVEVRPTGASPAQGEKRLLPPVPGLPEGSAAPASFALLGQALPEEIHRALVEDAMAQAGATRQDNAGDARKLDETRTPAAAKALASRIAELRAGLGVPDLLEAHLALRMAAIGDAGGVAFDSDPDAVLRFVYGFHAQPKRFSRGGIRLFDGVIERRIRRTARTFRDVVIEDNSLIVFPADVLAAGLPVELATRTFADGLFVLYGELRKGTARE